MLGLAHHRAPAANPFEGAPLSNSRPFAGPCSRRSFSGRHCSCCWPTSAALGSAPAGVPRHPSIDDAATEKLKPSPTPPSPLPRPEPAPKPSPEPALDVSLLHPVPIARSHHLLALTQLQQQKPQQQQPPPPSCPPSAVVTAAVPTPSFPRLLTSSSRPPPRPLRPP